MPRQKNTSPGVYRYEVEDGIRWGAVYYASPDPDTGKQRQRRKQGFATKAEALAWRVNNLTERNRGTDIVEPSRQLLCDYLAEWLDGLIDVAPSTRRNYRNRLVGINRELGGIALGKLTPAQIERCHAARLRRGDSATEVRYGHRVLKQALRKAFQHGLIQQNPADRVKPPRETKTETVLWTPEHMRTFITVNGNHPVWGLLWILLAETWLRISEASDLRWADIDCDAATISISHAISRNETLEWISGKTKTPNSRRTIFISAELAAMLRSRQKLAPVNGPTDLVFPAYRSGGFMKSQAVAHALERACRAANVPVITPHGLRHNGGSIAYMSGIDVKTISERMGHANIGTTLSLYVHLNTDHHRAAASQIAHLLGITNESLYDKNMTVRLVDREKVA